MMQGKQPFKQDRDGLPDAIIEERRFFEMYGSGKTDTPAGWNTPENWKELDEIPEGKTFGFAIGNNSDYLLIDFDHMKQGGQNLQWMIDIFTRLQSVCKTYYEISVSGEGLHMICNLGEYADTFGRESNSYESIIVQMDPVEYSKLPEDEQKKIPKVEFWYHVNGRYVYLTGKHRELIQVAKDANAAAIFHELLKIREEFHEQYGKTPSANESKPGRARFEISEQDQRRILDALPYISASSRETWVTVGIALSNCGFSFEVWDKWSQYADQRGGILCDKYDPKETPKIWKSFKNTRSNWNDGTIIRLARMNGFEQGRAATDRNQQGRGRNTFRPPDDTDVGQALVFRDVYGDRVRYSKPTDFLVYDGIKWDEDPVKAQKLAQDLTDSQLKEAREKLTAANAELMSAAAEGNDEARKAAEAEVQKQRDYFKYVLKRRMDGAIKHALTQVQPMVQIRIEDLDANPYLLNTPGGAVDLRTGTIRPNSPHDYCTKTTAVAPSPKGAELFADFLNALTGGDIELIEYLQIMAGMCAIGQVKQEKLIIAYGGGGNGKSTYFNLLFYVFGDYAGTLSAEALTTGRSKDKGAELAELRGKRLVIAAELEEGTRMDTAMVKKLCSTDPIHAEKKFKDPFHFIPSHTAVLYTNHLPKVGTTDAGTWDRLAIIPFTQRFRGSDGEVKNYAEHLFRKCGGAVLTWVIEGAMKFIQQDYNIEEPLCVREAIGNYQDENDWLKHFVEECCDTGANLKAPAGALYAKYKAYCEESGEWIRSQQEFKTTMERAGYESKKGTGGRRYFMGIIERRHFEAVPKGEKTAFEDRA